jgi:hypothetical protein
VKPFFATAMFHHERGGIGAYRMVSAEGDRYKLSVTFAVFRQLLFADFLRMQARPLRAGHGSSESTFWPLSNGWQSAIRQPGDRL